MKLAFVVLFALVSASFARIVDMDEDQNSRHHEVELVVPKNDDDFGHGVHNILCLSKLLQTKDAPCKKALQQKFDESGIKSKFLPVMLKTGKFTESEKDYLCCFNHEEFQCIKREVGDACENELPLIKQASQELTLKYLHVDCSERQLHCNSTLAAPVALGSKSVETDSSALLTALKSMSTKSDEGFIKISKEIKSIHSEIAQEYNNVDKKLNMIIKSMGTRSRNNQVESEEMP